MTSPPAPLEEGRAYASAAISVLLELFHDDGTRLNRVVETFQVVDTRVRRSISLTLTLPDVEFDSETPLLIPVTRLQRGLLIDNLDVEDATGRSLPVVSRAETRALSRLLLQAEFDRVWSELAQTDSPVGIALAHSEPVRMVLRAVRRMLSDIPTASLAEAEVYVLVVMGDGQQKGPGQFVRWLLEDIPAVGRVETDMLAVDAVLGHEDVRRGVEFFLHGTLKLVELRGVVPGQKLVLKYAYDSRFQNTESKSLNRLLGQRPYTFRFDTPLAFAAPSYHVRMQAPDGHYCVAQTFEVRVGGTETGDGSDSGHDGSPKFEPWDHEYETSSDPGLPYAHLYVSGLNAEAEETVNLNARLQFFEVPPGQTGSAFVVSLLVTVLLVAMAAAFDQVVRSGESGALFLAVVGAVAVWMRPTFDSGKLLQAPLSAKVGVMTAGGVALLGALDLVLASTVQSLEGAGLWAARSGMWTLGAVALAVSVELGRRVLRARRTSPV